MRLVLFDADGTIVDSQAVIHESMRLAFARFGYSEPPLEATRSIIGLTLDTAIATMLDRPVDEEILAMTAEYKEIYIGIAGRPDLQCRAFSGVPEIIHQLAGRDDILLGLVTGKSRRGVERLLESHGFANCFAVSRCADDCPSKPHPAMVLECCRDAGVPASRTMVIGDTAFDMEMARSAGAIGIGVAWGYHPAERMLKAGAQAIANDCTDLGSVLDRWLGGSDAPSRSAWKPGMPDTAFALSHA